MSKNKNIKKANIKKIYPLENMAFSFLHNAILSYVKTFQDISIHINNIQSNEALHTISYINHCNAAITNLHHFVELHIKDISKILNCNNPKKDRFVDVLESIDKTIKASPINEYKYITQHKKSLLLLNKERNKLIHDGREFLTYESLDLLFCKNFLPFLCDLFAQNKEVKSKRSLVFMQIKQGISPLDTLLTNSSNNRYDIHETGLLKEITRAISSNPVSNIPILEYNNPQIIKRSTTIASLEKDNHWEKVEIEKCPVCQIKSFVLFWTREYDEVQYSVIDYVYEAKCFNCSFQIDHNMSDINIASIDTNNYLKKNNT